MSIKQLDNVWNEFSENYHEMRKRLKFVEHSKKKLCLKELNGVINNMRDVANKMESICYIIDETYANDGFVSGRDMSNNKAHKIASIDL